MGDTFFNLNIQAYIYIFYTALLMLAGIKLFQKHKHCSLIFFSIGMAAVLLSQIVVPAISNISHTITSVSGWDSSNLQLTLFRLSIALNIVGLLIASISFTYYAFIYSGKCNVT